MLAPITSRARACALCSPRGPNVRRGYGAQGHASARCQSGQTKSDKRKCLGGGAMGKVMSRAIRMLHITGCICEAGLKLTLCRHRCA
eukprot:750430-Hanusia_phi.AAC.1